MLIRKTQERATKFIIPFSKHYEHFHPSAFLSVSVYNIISLLD